MIVTVANQKGGSGKTTVAVSLAAEWHRRGLRVLLIDADPQRSAATWAELGAEYGHSVPHVVSIEDGRRLRRQVPDMAADYDHVVIDSPPRISTTQQGALMVADLVLIPVGTGGPEAWALAETFDNLEQVQTMKPELVVRIVRNRLRPGTIEDRNMTELLAGAEYEVAATSFGLRTAFVSALTSGLGPTEENPESAAAQEVLELIQELERIHEQAQAHNPQATRTPTSHRATG